MVGYHYAPQWIPAGFVGVDIFFVISGFLITRYLLEHPQDSLVSFYGRRIRRLFPALVATLATVLLLGLWLLNPGELTTLAEHGLAATVFVSNWLLWHEAGYFDSAALSKPLLHLWSLAIEEQFYLLWPALLWLPHRRLLVGSLVLASLLASVWWTWRDPAGAYYLPLTRFWQLGVGGLLAMAPALRMPGPLRAGWVPGVLLLLSAWGLSADQPYPGWRALLPTLASLLILSEIRAQGANWRILETPWLVRLGLFSYPLYLLHWPLLVFLQLTWHGGAPAPVLLLAALLSVLLAWATWRFLESPLRARHWRTVAPGLLLAMLVVAVAFLGTWRSDGWPSRLATMAAPPPAEALPALREADCSQRYGSQSGYCLVIGDTEPAFALLGDSHAFHLLPGLSDTPLFLQSGLLLQGDNGCPPLLGIERADGVKSCREVHEAVRRVAAIASIRTVLLAARWPMYGDSDDSRHAAFPRVGLLHVNSLPATAPDPVLDGLVATIALLQAAGKEVVLVLAPPELGFEPAQCVYTRPLSFGHAPSCLRRWDDMEQRESDQRRWLPQLRIRFPQLTVFDPAPVLCGAAGCSGRSESGTWLYRDNNHLSLAGSRMTAAAIAEELQR